MPTSILTHQARAKSKVRENLRQATLEGASAEDLRVIVQALIDDEITYAAANDKLLAIRREARATQQQAA